MSFLNHHKNLFFIFLAGIFLAGCATAQYMDIHDAAIAGDVNAARSFLAKGADVNTRYLGGLTPLHQAASRGNVEMMKFLLENGANINIISVGMTPLDIAIYNRHTDAVLFLIQRGADVNIVSTWKHKFTALIYCSIYGNGTMARALLDAGADINARDNKGLSAVDYAAQYKKLEVMAALSKAGAQVSYTGDSAKDIIMAALSADQEKVRSLLEAGENPNAKSSDGKTLLEYSVENKWPSIVELLVKKGADIKVKDKNGWTLLMRATLDKQNDIVAAFKRAGAKIEYTGNKKDDLLLAILKNDLEKAKLLLAQGVDVNSLYRYKSPALNYAVVMKDRPMIDLLINNHADFNLANEYGVSPFMAAMSDGDMALAREMAARGADINARDSSGASALFYAVKAGDEAFVRDLLNKGVQVDVAAVVLSEGRNSNFKQCNFPAITALIKPELLRKQMLRAEAAQESAQGVEDYNKVLAEYEVAKSIAPETPEIWYNIGLIQDKAGNYDEAIANLRKYLQLAPNASDTQAVKDMIYKLEYKRDHR